MRLKRRAKRPARVVVLLLLVAILFGTGGLIWLVASAAQAGASIDALPSDECPDACTDGTPGSVPRVAIAATTHLPASSNASVSGPIDALVIGLVTGEPGADGSQGANATLTVVGNVSLTPSTSMTIVAPLGYDTFATAGPKGPPGTNTTIVLGPTVTGAPGTNYAVTIEAALLVFRVPAGDTGAAATLAVGTTTTGDVAAVVNAGTGSAAILNFTLQRGVGGANTSVTIGNVTQLAEGAEPYVTNVGVPGAAVLNFGLPVGATGAAGLGANITVTIASNGTTNVTRYVLPGPTGVVLVINETITYVAVPGPQGQTGAPGTVSVGSVVGAPVGSNASVTNAGNATAAVFNFVIPLGPQGEAASIVITSIASSTAGAPLTVANQGGVTAAQYQFTVPPGAQGASGTISVGNVTTLTPGSHASLANAGTTQEAIWNWSIPAGQQGVAGESAAVTIGSVTTLGVGQAATIVTGGANSSTPVLNFSIPVGANGSAAIASVGSVTTGPAGGAATVTNSGNSTVEVLNFDIPYALNSAQLYSLGGNYSCCPGNFSIFTNATNLNNFAYAGPDGLTYTGTANITAWLVVSLTFTIPDATVYPVLMLSVNGCSVSIAAPNVSVSLTCPTLVSLTAGKTFSVFSATINNDAGTFVVHQGVATVFA